VSALLEATAAHVPGPPELLPGRPEAVVDLQTAAGLRLVGGEWRYSDARVEEIAFVALAGPGAPDPLGPGDAPNRTYDVVPHAEAPDFDDSGWEVLAPEETMRRLGNGRVCFNWYRIAVTIPERFAGATIVFEVVVDDYAEVWVNGRLPLALGDSGGAVVSGFNAPNRVVLTRAARPGERFAIAVFGINGPISASPRNYIWLRSATLEAHRPPAWDGSLQRIAGGFELTAGPVWTPDGALLFSSEATGAIYRWAPEGRVTVFRPKSGASALAFDPQGRLTICQPGDRRVLRVEPHGNTTVLADSFGGRRLSAPGDLVHRSDGTLFFTDRLLGGIFMLRDGVLAQVDDSLTAPSGIALSPDERYLYVASSDVLVRYDLAGSGRADALADVTGEDAIGGLAVAPDGALYVCTPGGIRVLSAAGDQLRTIRLPEAPHNLAWGDEDRRTLYITAETSVYRLRPEEDT
jgi:gluconolactonase